MCEGDSFYSYYINGFVNQYQLWLGVESALLYAEEQQQFELKIWQETNINSCNLQLIGHYLPVEEHSRVGTIHMLYTRSSTHFNRLNLFTPEMTEHLNSDISAAQSSQNPAHDNIHQKIAVRFLPSLEAGVGLFESVSCRIIPEAIEQKIIAYLDMQDILICAVLNKSPWHRRMMEEIKRRMSCVTVYTWHASEASSERARGRMGHSALRTYSGGSNGKGIYASFYPGDCNKNIRHPSCHKAVSHFHLWNQEDRRSAHVIHLYGLDVDEINRSYNEMCDVNSNSTKNWSTRYNCSDVVFKLLQHGNLFRKFDFSHPHRLRFSILLGISVGFFFTHFFPKLLSSVRSLGEGKIIYAQYNNGLIYNRFKSNVLFLSIGAAVIAMPLMFFSSFVIYRRVQLLPLKLHIYGSLKNSLFACFFSAILPPIEFMIISFLKRLEISDGYSIVSRPGYAADFVACGDDYSKTQEILWCIKEILLAPIAWPIYKIYLKLFGDIAISVQINFDDGLMQITHGTKPRNYFIHALLCIASILSLGIIFRYLLDTTTTPKHIFNLASPIETVSKDKMMNNRLNYQNSMIQLSHSRYAFLINEITPKSSRVIYDCSEFDSIDQEISDSQDSTILSSMTGYQDSPPIAQYFLNKIYEYKYSIAVVSLLAIGGFFMAKNVYSGVAIFSKSSDTIFAGGSNGLCLINSSADINEEAFKELTRKV